MKADADKLDLDWANGKDSDCSLVHRLLISV